MGSPGGDAVDVGEKRSAGREDTLGRVAAPCETPGLRTCRSPILYRLFLANPTRHSKKSQEEAQRQVHCGGVVLGEGKSSCVEWARSTTWVLHGTKP